NTIVIMPWKRRRENHQLAIVKMLIREGNETLVARTIVPAEFTRWVEDCQRQVEDRLVVDSILLVVVIAGHVEAVKKGGGRQLLGITNNYALPTATNGTQSIFWLHL